MRRTSLLLALFLVLGAGAQVTFSPAPPVEQVLSFLQGMEISSEVKAAVGPVLGAGMTTGRAGTRVALEFLGRLSTLPELRPRRPSSWSTGPSSGGSSSTGS